MKCHICSSTKLNKFIEKKSIPVWTGNDDLFFRGNIAECNLYQCINCGHIQQFTNPRLEKILEDIYSSKSAQLSSSLGEGSWGVERAKLVIDNINLDNNVDSVLEIGSANSYMLEYFKTLGVEHVEGIDPSLDKSCNINGVRLHKAFASKKYSLGRKFDFIFSICVFEHIEKMNDIMFFVNEHLDHNGVLFFEVPNSEVMIRCNDPSLFIHEHIHCYTKRSICTLLVNNGFKIETIEEKRDSFFVYAKKSNSNECDYPLVDVTEYQQNIEKNIIKIERLSHDKKIGIHGVNNALNNIIGWSDNIASYKLFDNDENKIGQKFFGQEVLKPEFENIKSLDCIVVLPIWYFDDISNQYKNIDPNIKVIKAINGN